jgi:two-component system chemotaxis response regulator CheB
MGYIQKPSMNDIGTVAPEIREKLENIAATRGNVSGGMQPVKKASISFAHDNSIIAIGSSTGGTQALQRIFRSFPKEIPPVLVVQHIPAVFSKAFADRLNSICPFRVKEAEDGEKVEKNTVYIAPGGLQFKVRKRKVYLTDDAPVNRFKPSVDYLFNDLASRDEESIVAVMLTGMGKDGAAGMLKLKNKGALTLAQNEESCVVFGMPKEAIRAGGVDQVVHLDDMAEKIIEVYNSIEVKKKAS